MSKTVSLLGRWCSYSQKECFFVAVLFFVSSEFIFSLTAVILSSICVTIDTPASSAAEVIISSFSGTRKRKRSFSLWKAVFPFKAEKLYFHFEKDFEINVCLFLALNTTKMVLKHDQKVNVVLLSLQCNDHEKPRIEESQFHDKYLALVTVT